MSAAWYAFTTVGSATSLSAIFGAVLYLFGDGLPVMKTKIGVEFHGAVAEAVRSTKKLPNDVSAAGRELKYGTREVTAQFAREVGAVRRQLESLRKRDGDR